MALQLEPLAGDAAFYLFTTGFFFAALSSLVVNALIGAMLFVDGKGENPSMDERPVKIRSSVAMRLGLLPVLIFRADPIEILRIAQAFAIVTFPLLAFLALRISSDEEMMGRYANGPVLTVIGVIGYLAVIGFVLNYIYEAIGFVM